MKEDKIQNKVCYTIGEEVVNATPEEWFEKFKIDDNTLGAAFISHTDKNITSSLKMKKFGIRDITYGRIKELSANARIFRFFPYGVVMKPHTPDFTGWYEIEPVTLSSEVEVEIGTPTEKEYLTQLQQLLDTQ
jgi:hypothetical protein